MLLAARVVPSPEIVVSPLEAVELPPQEATRIISAKKSTLFIIKEFYSVYNSSSKIVTL